MHCYTKDALCMTLWISQDVSSGYQWFYIWLSASYIQETGDGLHIVCDSLSSCNTWRDLLLQPHRQWIPTMFIQPANHVMPVTRHTSKINTSSLYGQTVEVLIQETLWPFPPLPPHPLLFSLLHWSIHHRDRQYVLTCARCHWSSLFEWRGGVDEGRWRRKWVRVKRGERSDCTDRIEINFCGTSTACTLILHKCFPSLLSFGLSGVNLTQLLFFITLNASLIPSVTTC